MVYIILGSVRSGVRWPEGRCGRFESPPRDPPERRRFQVPRIPEGLASPDEPGPVRAVGALGHGAAVRVAGHAGRGRHAAFPDPGGVHEADAPRAMAGTARETVHAAMRGGPMIPPVPAPAAPAPWCPWRRRTPGRRSRGRTRRRRTPCSRTSRWPCARRRCRPRAAGPGAPASNPRPTRPGPPPAPLAGLAVTDVPPRRTPLTPDSRTTLVTRLRPIPAESRPCADNRARVSCPLPWFHHLPSS